MATAKKIARQVRALERFRVLSSKDWTAQEKPGTYDAYREARP